jgi:hypothetical protein
MVVEALAIRSLMPTKHLRNSYEQRLDLSLSSSVALHFHTCVSYLLFIQLKIFYSVLL